MNRAALQEGLRRMRFESLLDRYEGGELTQAEAAEMLGVSERTFRRWTERFEEEGEAGLCDRRLGRPSPKRAPAEEIARMLGLFKDKYADFTVKHFHEQLRRRHNYKLGYTVTKVHLHRAGLVRAAPKRSAHRKKRPRRPFVGMLLHQDGSRHVWLEGHAPLDLIVTLDDATGAIYSAFLVEEEGTASSFWVILFALYGPGQPLLLYAAGWREGVEDAIDTSRPGAFASWHRAYRRLLARSARTLGACVPHLAGPAAERVAPGRYRDGRSGQCLAL